MHALKKLHILLYINLIDICTSAFFSRVIYIGLYGCTQGHMCAFMNNKIVVIKRKYVVRLNLGYHIT